MKRHILNSPRLSELKKKRRKVIVTKMILFGTLFLLILILFVYVSRLDKLNISEIEVSGNNIVDAELIKKSIHEELAGHYMWVLPKTNLFFYPKNHLKDTLSQNFKRLRNINLSLKNGGTLQIDVDERTPSYSWCGNTLPASDSAEKICYFLDDTGYIFDEAPFFSGEVYFEFYGNLDGQSDTPSGSYFAKESFDQLILFKNTIGKLGLKPVALYVMDDGNTKIYLSHQTSRLHGPEIIIRTGSDIEKIAENLQAALNTEPLKSDFKNKYSSLLYIDLRFGNKVYYKFQ